MKWGKKKKKRKKEAVELQVSGHFKLLYEYYCSKMQFNFIFPCVK